VTNIAILLESAANRSTFDIMILDVAEHTKITVRSCTRSRL